MRETRNAQASIFEEYSNHEYGVRLRKLSEVLDRQPEILEPVAADLIDVSVSAVGRAGLSAESVLRCLVLRQQLGFSYEQLAFHLSDSVTYRTFTRLPAHLSPSRSCLQSTIRSIQPETLERAHQVLTRNLLDTGMASLDKLRIDSTVVASNIAPPSDSQLLNDGVRVIRRLLAKSKIETGLKVCFTDKRKAAKSLAFRIFNAKKATKDELYPDLLKIARRVLKQADRGRQQIIQGAEASASCQKWLDALAHYRELTWQVIEQTERRVIHGERVPSADKIVSLFEPHTDIIVKGFRDVQYGHKINLSSEVRGFITALTIEEGNPGDKTLFLPVLDFHQSVLGKLPRSVVADGGYASQANVAAGRAMGLKHVVFHKPVGVSLTAMGVKSKTFTALRHFRAGVEGNISELKRAFGATKAKWKGHDGFKAFVWASALSYNLVRLARLGPD
ncbi:MULTISPECIES: ISNCY family transposase [unclassified Marinobacter]|uniref:ISNCY family transposase n=1 Tax=unclassified Marinobacter TaxID=83889 RepID=UPI0020100B6B|nr:MULTISPECIES: ISNCY family transposase [unclassified Marinobacter]UQG56298.1 ISNCY family transposase [Marinobacter sp. M4C]UQG65102.1 ISNCY family transposase [Marinobacter sp. M2C]UQG69381.1 ISNCY family transposase [Marinobacter sp. M1C]